MYKLDKIIIDEIRIKLNDCREIETSKSFVAVLTYLENELKSKEIKELYDRITLNYVDELLHDK